MSRYDIKLVDNGSFEDVMVNGEKVGTVYRPTLKNPKPCVIIFGMPINCSKSDSIESWLNRSLNLISNKQFLHANTQKSLS